MTKQRTGREEVIKRLKRYAAQRRSEIDAHEIGKDLAQETDRGAIILLGALVEDALLEKIEATLRPLNSDEHARLFGPDAPIGSFSARIKLAYALRIIDRDLVKMCDLLREMRNACAHSKAELTFQSEVLRDALSALLRCMVKEDMDMQRAEGARLLVALVAYYVIRCVKVGKEIANMQVVKTIREDLLAPPPNSKLPKRKAG